MDNYSRGLVTTARAGVKRGVVVYLSALEQQNLVIQLVNFKGQSQLILRASHNWVSTVGDLKSGHSKSGLFEGRISNGRALAKALVPPFENRTI